VRGVRVSSILGSIVVYFWSAMRRGLVAIAITLALLLGSTASFGQVSGGTTDAGVAATTASTPVDTGATENLPVRVGKALLFGVVASAFFVTGNLWRRRGRRRAPRR
jgi:hypothetical protein